MAADQLGDRGSAIERGISTITLRDALVNCTFAPNRAISSNVKSLKLGNLGDEADALMALTLQHPEKFEYGKLLYTTSRHTLLIPVSAVEGRTSQTEGIGGEVAFQARIQQYNTRRFGSKEERQDRFIATTMHTHSDLDFPPSPQDMLHLFLGDENPSAQTAVFVVTNSRRPDGSLVSNKYILFRGPNTPQWSEEHAMEKVQQWMGMLMERVSAHITPNMSEAEQKAINARAQGALLRHIVRKYGLRLFTAVNGSPVAVEATA